MRSTGFWFFTFIAGCFIFVQESSSISNICPAVTNCTNIDPKQLRCVCNGTSNCSELDISPCDLNCSDYYRCQNNDQQCVSRELLCSQEGGNCIRSCQGENRDYGLGFKCQRKGRSCIIPQVFLKDDIPDCDNGQDLCTRIGISGEIEINTDLCFQCLDRSSIISKLSVCDGKVDCPDLSDECITCPTRIDVCDKIVTSFKAGACLFGEVRCGGGPANISCISRARVCNGVFDCSNSNDEEFSYCGPSFSCGKASQLGQKCSCENQCQTLVQNITRRSLIMQPDARCQLPPKDPRIIITCPVDPSRRAVMCNGFAECPDMFDELNCTNRFQCTNRSEGVINIRLELMCDGYCDCNDGSDETEETCPHRFHCRSDCDVTKLQNIDESQVCDFRINCPESFADELNCSLSERFYCESGFPLFIRIQQVNDGKFDCADQSDECREDFESFTDIFFHSRQNLIGSRSLFVFVWIVAILGLVGNLIVIVYQIWILVFTSKTKLFRSIRANHFLVLALAISGLLMGIYLFSLGIAYQRLSGSYCENALLWRSSQLCTAMGVIVLIASETSVLTMVLLTLFRLYAVVKPYYTSERPKLRWVILIVALIWAFAISVSALPLTGVYISYYPEQAWVYGNRFLPSFEDVTMESAKSYLLQSVTYSPFLMENPSLVSDFVKSIENAQTWDALENISDRLFTGDERLHVAGRFGYYNTHSVCLPALFSAGNGSYQPLSLGLTILNFVSFLIIAACYFAIYLLTVGRKSTDSADYKESIRLQWKIFRLIATDFVCWIPICILAFLKFGGYQINGDVSIIVALILLPINSAANPILYSSALPKVCGYVADTLKQAQRKRTRQSSVDTILTVQKSTTQGL